MKTLYILLLNIVIVNCTLGQNGLSVSFETGSQIMIGGQFKTFTKQYDDVFKSEIQSNFSQHGIPYRYEIGVNYIKQGFFGMGFFYSYSENDYRVKFNDKNQRNIKLIYKTPIDFGLLFGIKKIAMLSLRGGYATSTLISTFIYPDGTESISNGLTLNGVYSTFGTHFRIDLILNILKNLKLTVGVTKYSKGSEYMDKSYGKGLATGDCFLFPKDYYTYNELSNQGKLYDLTFDQSLHLQSTYFHFGILYYLNLTK